MWFILFNLKSYKILKIYMKKIFFEGLKLMNPQNMSKRIINTIKGNKEINA